MVTVSFPTPNDNSNKVLVSEDRNIIFFVFLIHNARTPPANSDYFIKDVYLVGVCIFSKRNTGMDIHRKVKVKIKNSSLEVI